MLDRGEFIVATLLAILSTVATYFVAAAPNSRARKTFGFVTVILWISAAVSLTWVLRSKPPSAADGPPAQMVPLHTASGAHASPGAATITSPSDPGASSDMGPPPLKERASVATDAFRTSNGAVPIRLVNRASVSETRPAVFVWTEGGGAEYLAQRIAGTVNGTDTLFRPEFVSAGHFERAMTGDLASMVDLKLPNTIPFVALGLRTVRLQPQTVLGQAMFRAESALLLRIYTPSRSIWSDGFSEVAISAAFNQTDAIRQADDQLAVRVVTRIRHSR